MDITYADLSSYGKNVLVVYKIKFITLCEIPPFVFTSRCWETTPVGKKPAPRDRTRKPYHKKHPLMQPLRLASTPSANMVSLKSHEDGFFHYQYRHHVGSCMSIIISATKDLLVRLAQQESLRDGSISCVSTWQNSIQTYMFKLRRIRALDICERSILLHNSV